MNECVITYKSYNVAIFYLNFMHIVSYTFLIIVIVDYFCFSIK